MSTSTCTITIDSKESTDLACKIQYEAFAAAGGIYDERHAKLYADLARDMIDDNSFSIIYKDVAHACYTPMKIDKAPHLKVYVLAPLAVLPEYQRKGYATRLIEEAEKRLDADAIFVMGEPHHYGRRYDARHKIGIPVKSEVPLDVWFAKELTKGCLDGIVSSSSITGPYSAELMWDHAATVRFGLRTNQECQGWS